MLQRTLQALRFCESILCFSKVSVEATRVVVSVGQTACLRMSALLLANCVTLS